MLSADWTFFALLVVCALLFVPLNESYHSLPFAFSVQGRVNWDCFRLKDRDRSILHK